jgi:hypothetical protein
MSTLIRSALIALVLTSASAAIAAPANDGGWTDMSKPYGGYAPNSQEGNRAFWDYQGRHGN